MTNRKLFACIFGLIVLSATSCTDLTPDGQKPDITTLDKVKLVTDMSHLSSRLVFSSSTMKTKSSAATKTTIDAPSIPANALKLSEQPTNWNNGVTLTRGKAYYIDSLWEGTISQDWSSTEGSIDIYMAANAKISNAWWNDDTPVNIYILPNAVMTYCEVGWDDKVKIKKGTNVYCWVI